MDVVERVKSVVKSEDVRDNMEHFTKSVDLYELARYETPSAVSERLGDGFSTLALRSDMGATIDTILTDEDSCKYPLLVTDNVPRTMPSIHEHIGEGTHGHVYSIVSRFGNMAVKFQNHSSGDGRVFSPGNGSMDVPMNEFALEVAIQLHASSIGISPNVYNAWISTYSTTWGDREQDVLVMDRLNETLFDKTFREKDYTHGVMQLISKMHENMVFHGDMHSGNIMIDGKNDPIMIDFGKSKSMPQDPEEKRWCMVHDHVLLYDSISRKSELKSILREKISELAPDRTVLGTTFFMSE